MLVHVACIRITMPKLTGVMTDLGSRAHLDHEARYRGGCSKIGQSGRLAARKRRLTVSAAMRRLKAHAGRASVVCLDPGHGGRDRANRGPTGYLEADGALDMALTAGMVLRSHGYKVVFTRDSDRDLAGKTYTSSGDLGGRVALANNAKVEVFVSIHTNAGGGSGTETYYHGGSAKGRRLAERVQKAVVEELGLVDRGAREAGFYVIRATAMPACLVEVAFHDNALEEQLLKQPSFRARAGLAIASGVMEHFREG